MPSHRDEIEELYREFCRPDEELLDVALDPDHKDYEYNQVFVAVTNDGSVIGFAAANRCGREWLSGALDVGAIEHRFTDKMGYFNTLCVAENWRGKGVGSALVRSRFEWLRSHDVQKVFGVSWVRDDGPSSKYLFEKFGFEELAHVHEYYYRDETPRRWCPDCGEPCGCDAKIYGREL
jgi:GNAT superfamily N-acetyltransferase